jgi:hemolysin III
VGTGWVAAFFVPQFLNGAGLTVCLLVALGGVLYSLGGLAYGMRRPNPSPHWFGFHEVFHSFTIVAYVLQYIAVSFVVYRAGTV